MTKNAKSAAGVDVDLEETVGDADERKLRELTREAVLDRAAVVIRKKFSKVFKDYREALAEWLIENPNAELAKFSYSIAVKVTLTPAAGGDIDVEPSVRFGKTRTISADAKRVSLHPELNLGDQKS